MCYCPQIHVRQCQHLFLALNWKNTSFLSASTILPPTHPWSLTQFPFQGDPVMIPKRLGNIFQWKSWRIAWDGHEAEFRLKWIRKHFKATLWSFYCLIIRQLLFFGCVLIFLTMKNVSSLLWQLNTVSVNSAFFFSEPFYSTQSRIIPYSPSQRTTIQH